MAVSPLLVNRIDVGAMVERHLHRFDHFLFGAGVLTRRSCPEPSGRHQRRAALGVVHERDRHRARRAPSCTRRRPSSRPGGTASRRCSWKRVFVRLTRLRHPRVHLRALRDEPLGELECSTYVPEPSGPGSLSPMAGWRTYTSMCSGVYPSRLEFGFGTRIEQLWRATRNAHWRRRDPAASCRLAAAVHLPEVSGSRVTARAH